MFRIAKIILSITLLLAGGVPTLHAENIFQKIARIGAGTVKPATDSISEDNESGKKAKKHKKNKDDVATDPFELSLDENLVVPPVNDKLKPVIVGYMNEVAKKLAQRKVARIETMRSGEVIVATINTDLLFAPNDTVLRSTAQEILSPYRSLLSRGMYKFILTCHTDDTGSVPYTDRLSEARVNAVDAWLSRNIPTDIVLVPYALGASEPLHPNDSQSNRAANRRIEIFIVPTETLVELAKSGKLNSDFH